MRTVTFEMAKDLQLLGYKGECYRWYSREGRRKITHLVDDDIPAPRLDNAAYFLRDKYGYVIYVSYLANEKVWMPHVYSIKTRDSTYTAHGKTYEEALENGLETAVGKLRHIIERKIETNENTRRRNGSKGN